MNEMIETVGIQKIMIAIAIFIFVLIFYYILRYKTIRKYQNQLVELENQMNAILSLPIQYRLGRVQGIVKNMPSFEVDYEKFVSEFDEISKFQSNELVPLINKVDEKVYSSKTRGIKSELHAIRLLLEEYSTRAKKLLGALEEITEVENSQRVEIIKVKEKFRDVNNQYQASRFKIEDFVPEINLFFNAIDTDFERLEDMMNKQLFDDAKTFTQRIEEKIEMLSANVRDLPSYISIIRKFIPQRINDLESKVSQMKERGFIVENLKYKERITKINHDIENISIHVKKLELETVGQGLELITTDVEQLFADFNKEEVAFSIYEEKQDVCATAVDHIEKQLKEIIFKDERLDLEFIIHSEFQPESALESFKTVIYQLTECSMIIESKDFSYDGMIKRYEQILDECKKFQDSISAYKSLKENIRIQEKRAYDELENIDIVLLEIKSQIKNKYLPMIDESYRDYIEDAYKKAEEIRLFTKEKPVDLERLMVKVDAGSDLIYKLYDNVHNLIVTAEMVEDAIVYGNRFRSSFLEVNTELTKAELLFKNGEYTSALSIAVDIIEKIKPGSYEMLVKKSQNSL